MITFAQLGKQGRRGNTYFQASVTIALALRNNDDYIFPHCSLENTTNIPLDKFSNNIKYTSTYEEPFFHYQEIPYSKNLNLLGYYQSYKYWTGYDDQIRALLTPRYFLKELSDTTSIHVRRTDYLNFPSHHPVLGMDYYNKAMELCKSKQYYVFSDDINWCKDNFKGNQFVFIEGNHETFDLGMMAKCENNIIANSSFSWWAAWLNNNKNKKVIMPQNWFGPALVQHNIKDLIVPDWIVI